MSDLVAIRDRWRLSGPTASTVTVDRGRLNGRYAESTGKVIRVLAPAGYGKSSIAARWVTADPRPARWLDLEPIDNDPLVLGDALLRGLVDLADGRPDHHGDPRDDVEHGLARRLADAIDASGPFVLVLDDVHHIDNERSIELVDLVAERLPGDSTLMLVGRAHHNGAGFARLRLEPGVIDVSTADLAFDLSETEALLANTSVPAHLELVEALAEQFEGWPAGLRLAAMAIRSGDWQPAAPSWKELGRASFITEYIAAEWLGGLDAADRTLLSEAGCLGRFSADMCDEVLCRTGSASALRRLVHEDVIVLPLDQHDLWYRMHPVLAGLLSAELRERDPQHWRNIQIAASRWWEHNRDIDLAVQHAATAGDLDLCEELVFRYGGEYSASCLGTTVERWLAVFDEERLLASPNLCVIAAINAPQTGDAERAQRLARLLRDVGDVTDEGATDDLTMFAGVMRLALEPRPPREAIAIAEHAVRTLQPGAWRVLAAWMLGGELFLMGDRRAEAVLRDAIFEAELLDLPNQYANTQATLAVIFELDGRREEATDLTRRAHANLGAKREESLATAAIVSAMVALVEARAGRHDLARDAVQRSRPQLTALRSLTIWFNVLGRLALARACVLLDDAAQAVELLSEVDQKLADVGERLPIADHVDAVRAEVDAATEILADRTWKLTDAELRVMQYLPTNLSLADIAARLFVSRNTVKSHAAAIYRKLGTTSRGNAVDIARRAGLLDAKPPEQ